MRYSGDGYKIAKALERHGWEIDAQMVECLNSDTRYHALDAAVCAWVAAEGIAPSLTIGTVVIFESNDGEITAIDARRATYTVMVPALGHVKTGLGTHGRILPYEQVEVLTQR